MGTGLAFLGFALPERALVLWLAVLVGVALITEVLRLSIPRVNRALLRLLGELFKASEARRVTGATYLALAALACYALFPTQVAALALLFLAVGDPVASLVGQRAPGPRFWGKSVIGTAAFALAASVAGTVPVLLGTLAWHPGILLGAGVAALAELLPLPVDDNLTVPLAAGLVLLATGVGG